MFHRIDLGHGIGLRPQHYGRILDSGTSGVDFVETITENLFIDGGRPWAVLERVRRDVPVVLHGVSLGIGDLAPLREYLKRLDAVIARVEPAYVSDHLCFASYGGAYAHDLLPIPYTEESLDHVARRVEQVMEHIGRPIMLENPSRYLAFRESTIDEPTFLNELARRTGAGVLLDVNNVYVTGKNLGFSAEAYIDAVDPHIVGQIHLAGHTRYDEVIIDTHVGPVPEPVLTLYARAIARCGKVPTLVEWDEEVPSFEDVVRESDCARVVEEEALRRARTAA